MDWKLHDNSAKEVEVQFEINRLTFCKWHLSLDELYSLDILYPDKKRIQSSVNAECDVLEWFVLEIERFYNFST